MKIILVRHTKPNIDSSLCYGQSDLELDSGFEKVDLLTVLAKFSTMDDTQLSKIGKIYSSPLKRCKTLAGKVADSLQLSQVECDNRLMERNYGLWELKRWTEDIYNSDFGKKWFDNYLELAPPEGESFFDLCRRADSFIRELKTDLRGECVIIVTHSGFISAFLVAAKMCRVEQLKNLKIEYGEVIEVEI
ncbi:MAG: histidine phosphatase family protein [Rikenellaceae bacterium]